MLVGAIVVLGLASGVWYAMYPQPWDPKNIGYVLWKVGLNPFENLDHASEAMVGDPHREDLVIGLSEAQLRRRFGYLLAPGQAEPVLAACYRDAPGIAGRKAFYIRQGWFLVTFKNGVANDLILMKPC